MKDAIAKEKKRKEADEQRRKKEAEETKKDNSVPEAPATPSPGPTPISKTRPSDGKAVPNAPSAA